jgi:hypothetical protein
MRKLVAAFALASLVCAVAATAALAAPAVPPVSGLYSPSHPNPVHWYAQRHVSFAWASLPGVAGYSYVLDHSPTTVPDGTVDTATAPGFAPRIGYAAAHPWAIALGDFNGDGVPDLAVANGGPTNTVSVRLNDGQGEFGVATDYAVDSDPTTIAVADFNGDGVPDLAVSNYVSNTVTVLLGDGQGGFGTRTDYRTGSGPYAVAVADFNGDGAPDLATANLDAASVSVFLGDGKGGFAAKIDHKTYDDPLTLAVGDFNGDGAPDLAVTDEYGADTFSVLLGDGNGAFGPEHEYRAGDMPCSVAVADFNGDGKPDLAVGSLDGVSVLLGNGNGGFGSKTEYHISEYARALVAGDFNGDGTIDLAVATGDTNQVCVLPGNGLGGFGRGTTYAVGAHASSYSMAQSIAVGDLNGDGRTDLAVSNGLLKTVSVLLGEPGATETANADGLWFFHLCGADGLADVGPVTTLAVRIDTHAPTTRAYASSIYPGHIAHLHCFLSDPQPCASWVKMQINITSAGGRLVRRVVRAHQRLGRCTVGLRCTLAPGTYRFRVYATDPAGNRQSKVGSSLLIVP